MTRAVVHRYLTVDGLLKPPPVSLPAPEEAKKRRRVTLNRGCCRWRPYTTCADAALPGPSLNVFKLCETYFAALEQLVIERAAMRRRLLCDAPRV